MERAADAARNLRDDDLLATVLCAQARVKMESDAQAAKRLLAEGGRALQTLALPFEDAVIECRRADAMVRYADGDGRGAIAVLEAGLAEIAAHPASAATDRMLLLTDLAEQHFNANDAVAALPVLEEVIGLHESIGHGNTASHLVYLVNHAAVLSRLGEVRSAAAGQRRALARVEGLPNPPVGMAGHYANSLLRLARYDEALELFHLDRKAAIDSGNARWSAQLDMQIGRTLVRMNRLDEAESFLSRAEAAYLATAGGHQRHLVMLNLAKAEAMLRAGQFDRARHAADLELARLGYPLRRDEAALSSALWLRTGIALALGDAAAAERLATDELALVSATARDPRMSADVGQALLQRGTARLAQANFSGAIADLTEAVASLGYGFGENHPEALQARRTLMEAQELSRSP